MRIEGQRKNLRESKEKFCTLLFRERKKSLSTKPRKRGTGGELSESYRKDREGTKETVKKKEEKKLVNNKGKGRSAVKLNISICCIYPQRDARECTIKYMHTEIYT